MGERYIEPSGTVEIKNTSTGDTCSLTYKNRGGFFTNSDNINAIDGVIKNSDGKPVFRIFGKFTDKIEAQNLETKEKWIVFTAPEYPENSEMMYNMNYWSLQLNLLSDELKKKLPPTDSRLRPDVRYWEHADLDNASKEKDRLENNQRQRRKKLQKILEQQNGEKVDMMQESSFYNPKFFDKEVIENNKKEKSYFYKPKADNYYWKLRE